MHADMDMDMDAMATRPLSSPSGVSSRMNSPSPLIDTDRDEFGERMDGEPGVVVCSKQPDIGPILTILLCSVPVQRALNVETDEPLVWARDWASAHAQGPPQSVQAELMKLCAHVHMNSGRARADAALLVQTLPELSDLDEFVQGLPLDNLALRVDGEVEHSLAVENISGKLCTQLDSYLTGKSVTFGDLILVQADARGLIQLDEFWYPQRCTNELSEISNLYRHVKNDMESALTDIRRKRLELRSYKGADVVEMLECAAATVSKYAGEDTASKLHQLSQELGHQRNELMDRQQDIDNDLRALRNAYNEFDDLLFTALKHEPVKVQRYQLVGLMLSAQEYYTRYQDSWFYVCDDMPSRCHFQTVREAARDASNVLAVYSVESDITPLEPSRTIRQFCLDEADAMDTASPSDSSEGEGEDQSDQSVCQEHHQHLPEHDHPSEHDHPPEHNEHNEHPLNPSEHHHN